MSRDPEEERFARQNSSGHSGWASAFTIADSPYGLDDFGRGCVLEAFYRRHDRRAAFVEELLPRFLLAAFDRDRDGAAIGTAGGRTATASISMSAPSRASPAMAMVVLAGLLWSGK
jgi:hypothetical protein